MKQLITLLLPIIMAPSCFAGCTSKPVITDTFYPQYTNRDKEYGDMRAKVKAWFDKTLENGTLSSAKIGEEQFRSIAARWTKDIKRSAGDDGHEYVTAVFTDVVTNFKFTLEATLFGDYPAVDYVVWAQNIGTANSPIINEFYAVDSKFDLPADMGAYTLNTTEGCYKSSSANDFRPVQQLIRSGSEHNFCNDIEGRGKSTDDGWPYFDLIGKDCGLLMAIGWTGAWESRYAFKENNTLSMKAKQYFLNATLFPKEKSRSPRVVLTYFDGDAEYGHNVWRKLLVEHYTPGANTGSEDRFVAPICMNFWGGTRESRVLSQVQRYVENGIKFDAVWFDAAWNGHHDVAKPTDFVCGGADWQKSTGLWIISPHVFPSCSFEPIANLIHKNNRTFMVWWQIEPGVISEEVKLTFGRNAYYNYTIKGGWSGTYSSLRLDDDAVLQQVIDYFDQFMTDNGVDWIRSDGGHDLKFMHEHDNEVEKANGLGDDDRRGMTENKYILNLYKLWHTLAGRRPGFMLDNCSGGGRRLDIEMTRRGIPLWRTDYDCKAHDDSLEARQAQTQWLSPWIPLSASAVTHPGRKYNYRSNLSVSPCIGSGQTSVDDMEGMKAVVDELVHLRPYWYGSYYQLLDASLAFDNWQAYELFREEWQKGVFAAIRRRFSQVDIQEIKLKGLLPDQKHLIHNYDDKKCEMDFIKSGKELMGEGFSISMGTGSMFVYDISIVLNR